MDESLNTTVWFRDANEMSMCSNWQTESVEKQRRRETLIGRADIGLGANSKTSSNESPSMLNDSCLLVASPDSMCTDMDVADGWSDMYATYVSELEPSSLLDSAELTADQTVDLCQTVVTNESKPAGCRSFYKFLVKTMSKRLGHRKRSGKPQQRCVETVKTSPICARRPVRHVYALNHKKEMPCTSTANTSTTTVAYLVTRQSNFGVHMPLNNTSPIGMKSYELRDRLNCGELFSYNV